MERIDLEIIREFIQRINKGPLKCPPDFEGDDVCVKIGYEVDEKEKLNDIYDCAVYQAWLDLNRTVAGAGSKTAHKRIKQARNDVAAALRGYFMSEPKQTCEAFDEWLYEIISRSYVRSEAEAYQHGVQVSVLLRGTARAGGRSVFCFLPYAARYVYAQMV